MRTLEQNHAEEITERRGNDGAVENLENQTAVSHVSLRPLEIANRAIPTFPLCRRRSPLHEYGKQKPRHRSPPPGAREEPQQGHSPDDEHLPEPPPAGYKIMCPESASYGRF